MLPHFTCPKLWLLQLMLQMFWVVVCMASFCTLRMNQVLRTGFCVSCVWSPGTCQGSTNCIAGVGFWLTSPTEDILGLKTLRFSSFCLQLGDCVQAPLHLFIYSLHALSDTLQSKMSSLKLRAWFASCLYLFQSGKSGWCDWSECLPTLLCLVQVRTRAQVLLFSPSMVDLCRGTPKLGQVFWVL